MSENWFNILVAILVVGIDPLDERLSDWANCLIHELTVCGNEIVDELQVFIVVDGQNWAIDERHEFWYEIKLGNHGDQVLVTSDGFESVYRLKGNSFVLPTKVDTGVHVEKCVLKSLWLLLEQHINQVPQEQSVSDLDQLTLIPQDLVNIVNKNFLNLSENIYICLFGMNVGQQA